MPNPLLQDHDTFVVDQSDDILDGPYVVGDLRLHCGRDAQGLMDAAEVVIHVVQRDMMRMVLKVLGECIRQAGKATDAHAHGQVLALDVGRRNVIRVRVANDGAMLNADALRWAVTLLSGVRRFAVQLHKHGVINPDAEDILNGAQIGAVAIGGQLHAVAQAAGQILDERIGVTGIALADQPRRDQLGIGVNGRPRPHVALADLVAHLSRQVLFLAADKRPDFIALNAFARQVAKGLVLVLCARLANLFEQAEHGTLLSAGNAAGRTNRISFDQATDDLCAALTAQSVHNVKITDRSSIVKGKVRKVDLGACNAVL